jgi:adenylate cyclase
MNALIKQHRGRVVDSPGDNLLAEFSSVVDAVQCAVAVGIWQFYMYRPSVEPASAENMAFPLPGKPSIVVLPFVNLSGDLDQDYISDGITENIISALSSLSELFVIDRSTAFIFKGKSVKVKQVAEELGVQYILEGSVQKSSDKVRINAQLVDALSGHHLWSEKYDREIKDFFKVLDEITHKVVIELQAKLTFGEQTKRWYGTTKFEAWSYIAKGYGIFINYSKANNEKARELINQALEIDPDNAFALVVLSWTYVMEVRMRYSKSPSESLKRAAQIVQKAQAIDDTLPEISAAWSTIYLYQRQYEKAIAEGKKSIELGPSNALNYELFSLTMYYAGNFDDAVDLAEQAVL